MNSNIISELERQYRILTTEGVQIRGGLDRIEVVRAVLGHLRTVKLRSRTGAMFHPIEALFRQEEFDESAYLFDGKRNWFKFELREGRGEIEFSSEFGISHLNVEFDASTSRLSLSIFGVGLVCVEEGIEALTIYPIQQWSGNSGDRLCLPKTQNCKQS